MKRVTCIGLGCIALLLCAAGAGAQGRGKGRRAAAVAQPAATAASTAAVPAGTPIDVRLLTKIDSGEAKNGELFTATLAAPVVVDGRTVLPKDAKVTGRVVKAVSSGRLKQPAALTLQLMNAGGTPLRSQPVTLDGKSHAGRNAALIGGGAAAGALLGAIAGGGKGAAIGAAAGAGAGTATAYLTGKKELVLPAEMAIRFVTAGGSMPGGAVAPPAQPATTAQNYPPAAQQVAVSAFSNSDRAAINSYLRANAANLPPGLARRGSLPPGLERQLQRNGTLPPGLQKRIQPFPADLSRRLAPLPAGTTRVFLGNRALLLDAAQRVLDMFVVE